MAVSDFFGADADGRPAVKKTVRLSAGVALPLRPLSLEQLLKLITIDFPDDAVRAASTDGGAEARRFATEFDAACRIVTGLPSVALSESDSDAIVRFYAEEHDWGRIRSELLSSDADGERAANPDQIEDLCLAVEMITHRTIERQAQMRPEAWLSLLSACERYMERKRPEKRQSDERGISGEVATLEQAFLFIPGGEDVTISGPEAEAWIRAQREEN
jgi:hypothetical protein